MLDKTAIESKRAVLNAVKSQLKTEFFGLDDIIDKVIDSLSAWFIFPEIITRPVIINLWGMTGVGKTQLVRRIVSLLEFQDKFVEVTMDGGSVSSFWSNSISSILGQSTIDEGQPGILLLDEIQRYRTVDEMGSEIKVERYQDVWTLLSDGKFSSDSSTFKEIEMMILQQQFDNGKFSPIKRPDEPEFFDDEDEEEDERPRRAKRTGMYPYEATNLKKTLRLVEPIEVIMTWDSMQIAKALENIKASRSTWEIDYTKLVIFISGNLDTAFVGSNNTEDCDTDADYYHELTKTITSSRIKSDLTRRFRPEQIARMGNNHIIYPSMSKLSYERLIKSSCDRYIKEIVAISDIDIVLDQSVLDSIYENSVYPTQGTRPVFTSIHKIFSNLLVNLTFWGIEHELKSIRIAVNPDNKTVTAVANNFMTEIFPIDLEISEGKKRASIDLKTLIAVHESGHAINYAVATGAAPFEVKINTAAYTGGYMIADDKSEIHTKKEILDKIRYIMAGRAAEQLIFGEDHITTGASSDIGKATEYAAAYVRSYGFHDYKGLVSPINGAAPWMTNIEDTNSMINGIVNNALAEAKQVLIDNMPLLRKMVDELLVHNTLSKIEFINLASEFIKLNPEGEEHGFNHAWQTFQDPVIEKKPGFFGYIWGFLKWQAQHPPM